MRLTLLASAISLLSACADGHPAAAPSVTAATSPAPAATPPDEPGPPGPGFAVWESSRTGAWRLWIRDFDGSPPRQLSPDEADRQHCCPHISPDGRHVTYLSLPPGQERYPESGSSGPMHLLAIDGTENRVVVGQARTYFEHRAAVWRNERELIYIDAEGRTRLLDLETGDRRSLTETGEERHGYLLNAPLSHATSGRPSFSAYDGDRRKIEKTRIFGGCQPYFSHDGRFGFWVAGTGGPIRAIDLATRQTRELLKKSDPRLPPDQGYLYFPMLSHDATLLAVAASPDEHDHLGGNYDVFVAATDPETLEVLGPAHRVTSHPASDRFPDVYSRPLPLGRHFGEVPMTVAFEVPGNATDWRFTVDGEVAGADGRLEWTFDLPGSYSVEAWRDGTAALSGFVRARPARPPHVVDVALRGREVVIRFDEDVGLGSARAAFESGLPIRRTAPGEDGRSFVVTLGDEVSSIEILRIEGVRDLAQRPNIAPEARLEVAPAWWPADRRGLVFLWQTGDALNEVEDPVTGEARTCVLERHGRAWHGRGFTMELAAGYFLADQETMEGVLRGCRRTNEITVEATFTPHVRASDAMARIISFSSGLRSRNFTLGQVGENLVFRLRTGTTGQNADRPEVELGPVEVGRPSHVLVTYAPGRLVAYLGGRRVVSTDALQDGFFHWEPRALLFGDEWEAERPWRGSLEAVAIYDRFMEPGEATESFRRAMRRLKERPEVPALRLRGTLLKRSRVPSLDEIAPYREGLAVFEYQVDEMLAGEYTEPLIRVVHRVLADGEVLPVSRRPTSKVYELQVEPFFDQPQLEALFLSDDLPANERPLYFSPDVDP